MLYIRIYLKEFDASEAKRNDKSNIEQGNGYIKARG
jgi:hypothetical protein